MKILFTNDDGYDAIGIQTLYHTLSQECDAYICAPLTHKSAFSHAINYADYLKLVPLTPPLKGFALDSTPADCARSALLGLFDFKFDLVLSGINYGVNAAQDIFYSGTIGAAREASFHGVMAIAISLDIITHTDEHIITEEIKNYFNYAAKIMSRIVKSLPQQILDYKGSIININFPSKIPAKGIKLTSVGQHIYTTELKHDTQGNDQYIKILSVDRAPGTSSDTDVFALDKGYIVVSALKKGIVLDTELQSQLQFLEDISIEE